MPNQNIEELPYEDLYKRINYYEMRAVESTELGRNFAARLLKNISDKYQGELDKRNINNNSKGSSIRITVG